MTIASTVGRSFAPGSVVVVRDEEWLVTATEPTVGGVLVHVHGLSEVVRDTSASFYDTLDDIEPLDRARRRWWPTTAPATAVPGSR